MRKIALTSLLAVFAAGAASAADYAPYASLKLGYVSVPTTDVEYKGMKMAETPEMTGYTGSVAGGLSYKTSDMIGVRGELEYAYANAEEDSSASDASSIDFSTVMINGYADFGDSSWVVKPYVGLGVGYTFGTFKDSESTDANGMAYAVSAGIGYAVDSNLTLDLGAKYAMNYLEVKDNKDISIDISTWSFLLGARYAF